VLRGSPSAHVGSALGDDPERRVWAEAVDLCEVDAAHERVERVPHLEGGLVLRTTLASCFRQSDFRRVATLVEGAQAALDFTVAVLDLHGVEIVEFDSLAKREDVLVSVVAGQCLADGLDRRLAPHVAELGERRRRPLSFKDRADDLHAGDAGDVADDVMKLQVHLHERLLHVLDGRSR
jgi:hypothetical protein